MTQLGLKFNFTGIEIQQHFRRRIDMLEFRISKIQPPDSNILAKKQLDLFHILHDHISAADIYLLSLEEVTQLLEQA